MKKRLVLVVEDCAIIAWDMQTILEKAGYDVLGPAPTYEEAMALIEAFRPDIALLDIELSGPNDGVEIARELMKLHIPALFVSAHAPPDQSAKETAIGHLSKPVDEERLIQAVRLVEAVAAGRTPSDTPLGFEQYNWRPEANGKSA